MRSWLEPPASCTQLVPLTPSLAASSLRLLLGGELLRPSSCPRRAFFRPVFDLRLGQRGLAASSASSLGCGGGGASAMRRQKLVDAGQIASGRDLRHRRAGAGSRLAQQLGDVIETAAGRGSASDLLVPLRRLALVFGRRVDAWRDGSSDGRTDGKIGRWSGRFGGRHGEAPVGGSSTGVAASGGSCRRASSVWRGRRRAARSTATGELGTGSAWAQRWAERPWGRCQGGPPPPSPSDARGTGSIA